METKSVEQLAKEARNAYYRKWRSEHKDNVKKHNATYWAKRALRQREAAADNNTTGVSDDDNGTL